MKVAVIGFNNLKYSPYIKTYTDLLDKYSIAYDVIIPNRNQLNETANGNLVYTEWDKKKNKLRNFITFAKKTQTILKKENYDFIFVLTTLPAILLSHVLVNKYKEKYLVDIRDYTYDKKTIFRSVEAHVLKHAHTRVISSPAFREFLPDFEYILCHNFSHRASMTDYAFERHSSPIRIGYIGSIAYVDECKRMIDLVKKDDRFCFYLYGNEVHGDIVSEYAKSAGTDRVKCFGEYEPAEKSRIILGTDILFNDYGNGSFLVKCALSNKLYDSFTFKKPLITSPDTIMSKLSADYSFDVDSTTKNLDALYKWYVGINGDEMDAYMNECLIRFEKENLLFEDTVRTIIGVKI